ncbi:hypothetical protein P2G88_02670 [Aliiglaciecola sp. CAU 1673]|uniref:hypothetical protein n=1 Tax=Aliiglaciecola sp. CAU 1673 TaxID=3032595 RepID=UPI0023DA345B|nr:hypothetical protein [Aliiglaciecola sp. CAU 1673]MDF2177147.1 hypothetical protein [Aliiglaciecola sp. CAU 1673]
MRRIKGYPDNFYPILLFVVLAVLVSGLLLIPAMLEFKLDILIDWQLPRDLRVPVLFLHAATGWIISMLIGALWQAHMRNNWRRAKHRLTGTVNAITFLLLGASALGLYYAGSIETQVSSAIVHTLCGLLLIPIFTLHGLLRR